MNFMNLLDFASFPWGRACALRPVVAAPTVAASIDQYDVPHHRFAFLIQAWLILQLHSKSRLVGAKDLVIEYFSAVILSYPADVSVRHKHHRFLIVEAEYMRILTGVRMPLVPVPNKPRKSTGNLR